MRKKKKLIKRSKVITQQLETTENPNIIYQKPVIIEHPKTSHKLCKAIRQAEKVSQVSSAGKNSDDLLYSETKDKKKSLDEKNVKISSDLMLIKVTQVLQVSKL